jgi:hypothetical protein
MNMNRADAWAGPKPCIKWAKWSRASKEWLRYCRRHDRIHPKGCTRNNVQVSSGDVAHDKHGCIF